MFCGAGPSGSQFPHGSMSSFVLPGFLHLSSRWFLLLILLSTLYLALLMKDFHPLCYCWPIRNLLGLSEVGSLVGPDRDQCSLFRCPEERCPSPGAGWQQHLGCPLPPSAWHTWIHCTESLGLAARSRVAQRVLNCRAEGPAAEEDVLAPRQLCLTFCVTCLCGSGRPLEVSWFPRDICSGLNAPSFLVCWPLFTIRRDVFLSDELSAFLRPAYRVSPLLVK